MFRFMFSNQGTKIHILLKTCNTPTVFFGNVLIVAFFFDGFLTLTADGRCFTFVMPRRDSAFNNRLTVPPLLFFMAKRLLGFSCP